MDEQTDEYGTVATCDVADVAAGAGVGVTRPNYSTVINVGVRIAFYECAHSALAKKSSDPHPSGVTDRLDLDDGSMDAHWSYSRST